jgi:hypothetical protein
MKCVSVKINIFIQFLHTNIKQCKCKIIYIYMSLHGYVKQCK